MPLEADLIELMLDEITIEPWIGSDRFANAVYGSPRNGIRCRIEHNTRRILSMDGREVISSVQIILADPTFHVSTKDRLTLPDNAHPEILRVAEAKDDVGPYYEELFA